MNRRGRRRTRCSGLKIRTVWVRLPVGALRKALVKSYVGLLVRLDRAVHRGVVAARGGVAAGSSGR